MQHNNKEEVDDKDIEQVIQEEDVPEMACGICGKGEATWHHWIDYCPVYREAEARLGIKEGISILWITDSKEKFALMAHVLAEMIFVRTRGGVT